MDQTALELAGYLIERLERTPSDARILVGLAGVPAGGKSTLAGLIVTHANKLLQQPQFLGEESKAYGATAVAVGIDGWHLTRAQLDSLPDPQRAHKCRGSHWTFDALGYASFVATLRAPLPPPKAASSESQESAKLPLPVLTAPAWDHSVKDPIKDGITVRPTDRIVILEGLYAFFTMEPWVQAGEVLNERWLIDVDPDEATRRIILRHFKTGITQSIEEATLRAEGFDRATGRVVLGNSLQPTRRIRSINFSP
ncbi:P-loop containing nucleoside triphosphate hydrolase protein [Rickenella mellea]|uniref:P-loop containing nucleoside triphosphate hydrolase protein n=1 Tax=Rickenella mellea TaxID=50990 RepID=A0A4Y7Q6B1_9AGAM|nr:P-loop containing nucleoside triphosphate hydrolase protein [Rickenella mellea]